jgi:fatty acid amide hydrolase 2
VLPFMTKLQAASGTRGRTTSELLEESGETAPTWGSLRRAGSIHTAFTRIVLASELLPDPGDASERRGLLKAADSLASELIGAIGDGVLLHPAHPTPAPRHRRTYGRPWLLTPAAVFNLAGVPVTEVPLGRSPQGLPVGVQVAAGPGRDHVSIAVALELERIFGGWKPPA